MIEIKEVPELPTITGIVECAKTDTGYPFQPECLDFLGQLESENAPDYHRVMAALKGIKSFPLGDLKKQISQLLNPATERESQVGSELADGVEPWPEPVNGAELIDAFRDALNKYCVLPDGAAEAIALWALLTYTFDLFRILPKLMLMSPEKRCGKTTLLEVITALVHKPLNCSNVTPAPLFRAIDAWKPTLMIDECDSFMGSSDELRGIVNCGHTKSGAFVLRCVGDTHEPQQFNVFSPMVLAGIGRQAGTIEDRAIKIRMRRKMNGESVDRLPYDLLEQFADVRRKAQRWAIDSKTLLMTAKPTIPNLGNDRAENNWESLIAIAETINTDEGALARRACATMEDAGDDDDTKGVLILQDIRNIFEATHRTAIHSEELVRKLVDLEERPWSEWKQGSPITQNILARLLKPYDVKTKDMKISQVNRKGYSLSKFEDAFARYLPIPPARSATPLPASNGAACSDFQGATGHDGVALTNRLQPSNGGGSSGVALPEGGAREENEKTAEIAPNSTIINQYSTNDTDIGTQHLGSGSHF